VHQVNHLRLINLAIMQYQVPAINFSAIFNTYLNKFLCSFPLAHLLMSTMLERQLLHHRKLARTKIKVEKVVLLTSCSLLLWMLQGKINTLFSQKNLFFQSHIAFLLVFQICILSQSLLSKCWSLNFSKFK
jgi:hypothetical protein